MQFTYYKFDASKLTLAELWRCCNNVFEFLVATVCRLIRVNVAPPFAIARTDRMVRVAAGAVPPFAQSRMSVLADEAETLGFTSGFYFTIPTVGALEGYSCPRRGGDGRIAMAIDFVRISVNMVVNEKVTFYFLSKLQDGRYLTTSGSKREENAPPNCEREHLRGRPMAEVYQRHCERLAEQTAMPEPVADDEQLERLMFEYERGIMDYQIGRAVFVAVTQDEVERLRSLPKVSPSAVPQDTRRQPSRILHWMEWACWFALLFGIYLFGKGEEANQAQLAFRLALLGGGLLGVIGFLIARLVRASS
jgi:hypothetical protein